MSDKKGDHTEKSIILWVSAQSEPNDHKLLAWFSDEDLTRVLFQIHICKPGVKPFITEVTFSVENARSVMEKMRESFLWKPESETDAIHFRAIRSMNIPDTDSKLVWGVDHDGTSGTVIINDTLTVKCR